jgi:hypothetical membrane protein
MTMSSRVRAAAGIAGPIAFVLAWSTLGARRSGYSPIERPISRLAEVGAPSRAAMTAGFAAFSAGVAVFSPLLRDGEHRGASRALAANAVATLGVAAFPLGASYGDTPHAVAAGLAYASLAATPLLAAGDLRRRGARRAAAASVTTAIAIAAPLVASTVFDGHVGLAQRLGLTIGDVWIVVAAVRALRQAGAVATPMRESARPR